MMVRALCLGLVLSLATARATTWDFMQGLPADGTLRTGAQLIEGRGLYVKDGMSGSAAGFRLDSYFEFPEAFRFEAEFESWTNGESTVRSYLWDDMYRSQYARGGLQVQINRSGSRYYPTIILRYADSAQTIEGPRVYGSNGKIFRLSFVYDAKGGLTMEWDGRTDDYEVNVHGPILKADYYRAILGDTVGSVYSPLEGFLRRVTVEPYVAPPVRLRAVGCQAYERGESGAKARFSVRRDAAESVSSVVVYARQSTAEGRTVAEFTDSVGDFGSDEMRTVECPVETCIRPGAGWMDVVVSGVADGGSFAVSNRFVVTVGQRFAPRMPVTMWGYSDEARMRDFGFTHGSLSSFGFTTPQPSAGTVHSHVLTLDHALETGFKIIRPWKVYLPSDADDGRYYRQRRDGSCAEERPEVSQTALRDHARAIVREETDAFGRHPAFGGTLTVSEQRDKSFPSFNTDDERFTAETGLEIPDEVVDKRPNEKIAKNRFKTGIVPENDPLYAYYRWYWKGGDGWAGYQSAIADEYRKGLGGQPFFSFFDPAVRAPAVWGAGGSVDVLSQWCYANPEPMNVAGPVEELFAMAEGRPDQQVMVMTQLFCYRSKVAPTNVVVDTTSWWLERYPDASYVSVPPDVLQEATWSMIAKPVRGIMYHGLGSIVDSGGSGSYSYTNDETPERLRRLLREVVAPLGPSLLKIGRDPQKVAVMESGVTGVLGGPASFGWTAPAVTFFQRARLDPKVVYEESVLSNGLDGVEVLYVPQLRYTTQAVVDRLQAFQRAGGLIVGDEETLSAVTPDIVAPLVKFTAPPLSDTAEDIDIEVYAEGADVNQRSKTLNAKLTMQNQAEDIRTALAAKGYAPQVDSSTSEIVVYSRRWQDTPYVFAVNDKRDFGDYLGPWGLIMESGCACAGDVFLADPEESVQAVYELSRGGSQPFSRSGGRVRVPVSYETNDGRLFAFLKEPIGSVALDAPEHVVRGEAMELVFRVLGTSGAPVDAVLPVEVHVLDVTGRELDGAGYAAAEGGICRISVPTNLDDPAGAYTVWATDRASGLSVVKTVGMDDGTGHVIASDGTFVCRWDGQTSSYVGGRVQASYAGDATVSLVADIPENERIVIVGDPAVFAADAVIVRRGAGRLVFSNAVVSAGSVIVEGEAAEGVRSVELAGSLDIAGSLLASNHAEIVLGPAAVGCDFAVPLSVGTGGAMVFRDCGSFTNRAEVAGADGEIRYESSDAPAVDAGETVVWAGDLDTAGATVLAGADLSSVTGITARIHWRTYKNENDCTPSTKYRGDLRPTVWRDYANFSACRFQVDRGNTGMAFAAVVRLDQDGENVVAKKSTGYYSWSSHQPGAANPDTWDPFNDPSSQTKGYSGTYSYYYVTNLTFHLSRPRGVRRTDFVVLAGTDTTVRVAHRFCPGANRELVASVASTTAVPYSNGKIHVEDRARLFLRVPTSPDWSRGLGHSQNPARHFVYPGGQVLSMKEKHNSVFQTLEVAGGNYHFNDYDHNPYNRTRGYSENNYVGHVIYSDGGRTSGDASYLGSASYRSKVGDPSLEVVGNVPCVCDNGWNICPSYTDDAPGVFQLKVEDVTDDAEVDFTINGRLKASGAMTLVKSGAGTALLAGASELDAAYPARICDGTLLLGATGCLNADQPVSLEGGSLSFASGTTNVLGALTVAADSKIEVSEGAVVRFGDSSAQAWAAGRRLNIVGDPDACEIRFGDSNQALTPEQMLLIRWNEHGCTLDEDGRLRRIPGGLFLLFH